MAEKNWEPDVTLDRYIYDYFVKRELHEAAKAFMEEAKVAGEPVEIDAPGGFLYEWWSILWDMYVARCNQKDSESTTAYYEAKERQAREHQKQIQMMKMLQQRNVPFLRRDPVNPSFGGPLSAMNSNEMLGQPSATASVVTRKMYEEHVRIPQFMGSIASTNVIDAGKMPHLTSAANQQSNQLTNVTESRTHLAHRPHPMDPAYVCGQTFMQSNSGSCVAVAGLKQGVPNMPLNGWPLTEPDRPQAQLLRHNNLNNQTQIMLGHSQAYDGLQNSYTYVDTNHHKFGGVSRRSASAINEQSTRYDASMRSPSQSSSPKMSVQHDQNASSQHPQEQKLQNNSKRRRPSSSGPATGTGYGNTNTSSRSPNSPSSTQTPDEGTTKTPNNLQPANNSTGNMMMYQREGSPGLLAYDNLEDINNLVDMSFLDDNVESFLNNEEGQGRDGYS